MLQIVINEPELKAQLDLMKANEEQAQQHYNKAKRYAPTAFGCSVFQCHTACALIRTIIARHM